jgi:hypothetical protein
VRLLSLRQRAWRVGDYGSPYFDPTAHAAIVALSEHEVTAMASNEQEVRYPRTVASLEQLAKELQEVENGHRRYGLCGWICAWVDRTRVVRWVEASRLVEAWRQEASQNRQIAKSKLRPVQRRGRT